MSIEEPESEVQNLQLEDTNFRVCSDGWPMKTSPSGQDYKECPEGGIWELTNCKWHPELNGEQLFTWDAAMRETKKAGKRIPTDEEWGQLLKTKEDMPNLVFAGYRSSLGSFGGLSRYGFFWSSSQSGSLAWRRFLFSGVATVFRKPVSKTSGFSVRCLKD